MRRAVLLAVCALGIAAADDSPSRELTAALAGRVSGPSTNCLTGTMDAAPRPIDARTLLYREGKRLWVNRLPAACPGLDADAIVVSEIDGGSLCRNDRFYTLERLGGSIPGPRCRLGAFTPYDVPPG